MRVISRFARQVAERFRPIQTIIAAVRTYLKTGSLPPLPAKSTELG
jgi:hypothetical protein